MTKINHYSFDKINQFFFEDLLQVERIISKNSKGNSELIHKISQHIFSSGGKRIRPILAIVSSRLCGYKNRDTYIDLAASIELIHTATLLHDDVIDEGSLRRGISTSNVIWGNKASILVGDYLFSIAFNLMVKSSSVEILKLLAYSASLIADGEIMQLGRINDINLLLEDYIKIISYKTASLFSAATELGAILSQKELKYQNALSSFGKNLGIIFQIVDDILDYCGGEEKIGKKIGTDFKEKKVTLPIILLCKTCSTEEKKFLKHVFLDKKFNDQSLKSTLELINKYNIIKESYKIVELYKNKAINNLKILPDAKEKFILLSILEYFINRNS